MAEAAAPGGDAPAGADPERRVDDDGEAYTFAEFQDVYHDEAQAHWDSKAVAVAGQPLPDGPAPQGGDPTAPAGAGHPRLAEAQAEAAKFGKIKNVETELIKTHKVSKKELKELNEDAKRAMLLQKILDAMPPDAPPPGAAAEAPGEAAPETPAPETPAPGTPAPELPAPGAAASDAAATDVVDPVAQAGRSAVDVNNEVTAMSKKQLKEDLIGFGLIDAKKDKKMKEADMRVMMTTHLMSQLPSSPEPPSDGSEERRQDGDAFYTFAEFQGVYHDEAQAHWEAAKVIGDPERREDDGVQYTFVEFQEAYGDDAQAKWDSKAPAAPTAVADEPPPEGPVPAGVEAGAAPAVAPDGDVPPAAAPAPPAAELSQQPPPQPPRTQEQWLPVPATSSSTQQDLPPVDPMIQFNQQQSQHEWHELAAAGRGAIETVTFTKQNAPDKIGIKFSNMCDICCLHRLPADIRSS